MKRRPACSYKPLFAFLAATVFMTFVTPAALAGEEETAPSPLRASGASRARETRPSRTYAELTIVVDVMAWALGVGLAPPTRELSSLAMAFGGPGMPLYGTRTLPALGLFVVGPPVVHLAYGQWKSAIISTLARVAVPSLWAVFAELQDSDKEGVRGVALLAAAGAFLSYPSIVVVDAAVLAKTEATPRLDDERKTATTKPTTLLPSFDIGANRATIGVAGTF